MLWRLWIPGRLPGFNEIVEACGKRIWLPSRKPGQTGRQVRVSGYDKLKKQIGARIKMCADASGLPPLPDVPVVWVYMFRVPDRRRDPSNIAAGAIKIIEDGLQECGLLKNDGHRNVSAIYSEFSVDVPLHEGVAVYPITLFSNLTVSMLKLEEEIKYGNPTQRKETAETSDRDATTHAQGQPDGGPPGGPAGGRIADGSAVPAVRRKPEKAGGGRGRLPRAGKA